MKQELRKVICARIGGDPVPKLLTSGKEPTDVRIALGGDGCLIE